MSSHRSRSRSPGRNDHHQDYSPPQNDESHINHSGDRDPLPPRGGVGDGDGCKLYVGNLDFSSDEHRLREAFGEFGAVTDVYLPRDRYSSRPRGFGFVTLESRAAAERAISQMDQSQLDGRRIIVNESKPQGQGPGSQFNKHGDKDVKLYVGNLSLDTSEETLKDFFSRVGPVLDCYFPTDRDTNQPRGFGFITMSSEDAEKACHQLDGEEIDGRNIRVNEARPKGPGGSRGGGYNDGSGYGGGRGGYGGSRSGYGGGGGGRGGYDRDGYGGGRGGGGYDGGRSGGYDGGRSGGYDGGRSGGGYDNRRGGGRYDDRGGNDEGRGGGGHDNRGGYESYAGRV